MTERPAEAMLANSAGWLGEGTFRVLSYVFTVRWSWEEAGAYVRFVLDRFAASPPEPLDPPTPGGLPDYAFTSTGGTYRLMLRGQVLAESADQRDVLNHFSWHVNSEAMRSTGDFLLVHAGAVVTPSGAGVLLAGPSGSGKTSLVAGLVREGFGYLSDEAGAIDPVTRRLFPYPKALSIKPGMFDRLVELRDHSQAWPVSSREWLISPEQLRPGAIAGPCEIGLVILLRRRRGAEAHTVALSAAEAVIGLADNTSNMWIYGPRAPMLLADVVRGAACYSLETGAPEDAVRTVIEISGSVPAA